MRTDERGVGTGETADTDATIEKLNKLLRGELSAVETYEQAIDKIAGSEEDVNATTLEECKRSHEERAEMLRQQVLRLGGEPSESSGPWGGFARLVEGGARVLGVKPAIAALEEGEDHGKRLYADVADDVAPSTREFIRASLLPEQERTHAALSALKHRLRGH